MGLANEILEAAHTDRYMYSTTLFAEQGDKKVGGPTLSLKKIRLGVEGKASFVAHVLSMKNGKSEATENAMIQVDLNERTVKLTGIQGGPLDIEGINKSVRDEILKMVQKYKALHSVPSASRDSFSAFSAGPRL